VLALLLLGSLHKRWASDIPRDMSTGHGLVERGPKPLQGEVAGARTCARLHVCFHGSKPLLNVLGRQFGKRNLAEVRLDMQPQQGKILRDPSISEGKAQGRTLKWRI
jgi:hypothetical protein